MTWIDLGIEILKAVIVAFPLVFLAYVILGRK